MKKIGKQQPDGRTREKQFRTLCIITWVLLGVSFVVMYMTHKAVPFMMDDNWYSKKLFTEQPISSLKDIVEFQIWHYQNWGGRSITHTILQLVLMAGESIADVLNVFVTILLCILICIVSDNRKVFGFFGALSLVIGLNANWKMSMFWQSGAANYLYITVFILIFLHCYLRETEDEVKPLPGIIFWIIPLGLLAGWSNENMGPAVWLITIAVMVLLRRSGKKIRLWMILGSVFCLIGSGVLILAPGNFVRTVQVASNEYGLLWNVFLRCYAESKAALDYLFPTLLVLGGMLVIAKGILKITLGRKNLLLLACALLSWGAMILSPHYPDRAAFGTMVLLICVILSLGQKICQKQPSTKTMFWSITVLIWLRGMYFMGEWLAINWGWIK